MLTMNALGSTMLLLIKPHSLGDTVPRVASISARATSSAMSSNDPSLRELIMSQRAAGKSEQEILQSLGDLIGASADLIDDPDLTSQLAAPNELDDALDYTPEILTMPRAGEEPFGRWFQAEGRISLELFVDVERSKDIRCEVSVGFLDVRVKDEPILSGRLAQPVLTDLDWVLDSVGDGSGSRRLLCIELTKRQRTPVVDSGGGFGIPLFESLKVQGDEPGTLCDYFANGLVTGRYLPPEDFRSALTPEVEDSAWSAENDLTTG